MPTDITGTWFEREYFTVDVKFFFLMTCSSFFSLHLICLICWSFVVRPELILQSSFKESLVWHALVFYYSKLHICDQYNCMICIQRFTQDVIISNVPYIFNKYTLHCSSLCVECCLFPSCIFMFLLPTLRRVSQEGDFMYLMLCLYEIQSHNWVPVGCGNLDCSFVFFEA